MAAVAAQNAIPAHNLSKSGRAKAEGRTNVTADSVLTIPRGDVTVTLNFYKAPEDGSLPFAYVWTPQNNYGAFLTSVTIHDIRGHEDEYNLDKDAFKVIHNVPDSVEKDFRSEESIKKNYYPEVEKVLLENVPGSYRVVIFDHAIRRPNETGPAKRGPVLRTHIDQSPGAVKECVMRHLGEEAETLLQGRYRMINVWRPLNGPVTSFPLSFASSASVEDADLIPIEHRDRDHIGETVGVRYNEGQRWHYLSGMQNDERLLSEGFDSEALNEGSSVRGGRGPHSAFEDPRTPVGAPGRESIEVRTLVFGP